MGVYDINGNRIDSGGGGGTALDYDKTVRSVNHRGFNTVAPENTIPAFKMSKEEGFSFVETDVQFTSDGVAVLLHDKTINRTARNMDGSAISTPINISDITYAQALTYDFGIWKGAEYAGTPIPTLAEFLELCKDIMLYPYIELKSDGGYTQAQVESVIDMVNAYGLKGKATYISFSDTYLNYVKNYDEYARLGYLTSSPNTSYATYCRNLQTKAIDKNDKEIILNEVYLGAKYQNMTTEIYEACAAAGIPVEVWTVNTSSAILALDSYVSGVTSDSLIAGKVLYDSEMAE